MLGSVRSCVVVALAFALSGGCTHTADDVAPATRPSNRIATHTLAEGDLVVQVHSPGTHYRGRRFDWSGMIGRTTFGKRVIWEEWNADEDRDKDDANAVGPAMEFGMERPLGYEDAAIGEAFVKIGVGLLRRESDKPYFFRHPYAFAAEPPPWVERSGPTWYQTSQSLESPIGYGYRYRKSIQIERGGTELVLKCELTNTGTKTIETDVYVHNFFRLNGNGWQEKSSVKFERPVSIAAGRKLPDVLSFDATASTVTIVKPLKAGQACWVPFVASPGDEAALARSFRLSSADGLNVRAEVDRSPKKFVLFGLEQVTCVEPFVDLHLLPGEQITWTYRYEFEFASPQPATTCSSPLP